MDIIHDHTELKVYQKAFKLSDDIYKFSKLDDLPDRLEVILQMPSAVECILNRLFQKFILVKVKRLKHNTGWTQLIHVN